MKWITRSNVKVDRVACPWLIRRFVDQSAEFLFVEEAQLLEAAAREHATPFDAPRLTAVKLIHRGERCSFEAIIEDQVAGSGTASAGADRASGGRQRAGAGCAGRTGAARHRGGLCRAGNFR